MEERKAEGKAFHASIFLLKQVDSNLFVALAVSVLVKWQIATDRGPQVDIRFMAWDSYAINKISE